jgi:hypothetical protein
MPEAKFGYRNESSGLLTLQNEMQAVYESTGRAYRLSLESRSSVRPTLILTVSRLTRRYTETGFEIISLQLNDHTDRGVGGRQYGASEDIETLQSKNNTSS